MELKVYANDIDTLKRDLDIRFRGPLMSFFLRRVRNRSECEDLTQEVFARLVGVSALSDVENVDAFVFRVAANLLYDRARHAKRWRMFSDPEQDRALVEELTRIYAERRDPERVLLGKEKLSSALASLRAVGDRTFDIFILFRVENMKQREIAALYGVSTSAVEKHISKAIMQLALWRRNEEI